MDKGLKLTETERIKLIERVKEFLDNHRIPGFRADLIKASNTINIIFDKKINDLINRINDLRYIDKLEENTERMINYLLVLYNVYYNIHHESMTGEYISAFRFFNLELQDECIKTQIIIENMIKKNIAGDIYKGSTSKWEQLLKELRKFYTKVDLNLSSEEEITKKAEYIKEKLRLQGCSELDIREYDYNKIISLNACGFEEVQPVFKVLEYYHIFSGDDK
jgi:hypothetical protein|uniref:Uncharacterized protein n=1 Tax=Myoviridae sp. ctkfK18 TaxID=2825165 RepID=A0A8S5VH15_9CAUD|nr:MAG TPA: hypothetical protein [Myoviridae sp. ctkfK18]